MNTQDSQQRERIHWTVPATGMEEQPIDKSFDLQNDKKELSAAIDKFCEKYEGYICGFAIIKSPRSARWRLADVIMDGTFFRL